MGPVPLIDLFRRFYGPTMNAFDAAEKNGKSEELYRQLVDQARAHNKATDGGTMIPATFMRVTVVRVGMTRRAGLDWYSIWWALPLAVHLLKKKRLRVLPSQALSLN